MRSVATILAVSCLLLVLVGPSDAAPKFAQYPAPVYFGPVGRLDLSSPESFAYRTRLRAASQGPVNFAGHFQIATWGCGAGCVTGAMVDAFTGHVTFLPSVSTAGMEAVMDENFNAFEFRNNSRLIVLSGKLTQNGALGAHFFAWDGAVLIRVDTVAYSAPTNVASQAPSDTPTPSIEKKKADEVAVAAFNPTNTTIEVSRTKGCWSIADATARLECEHQADSASIQTSDGRPKQAPSGPAMAQESHCKDLTDAEKVPHMREVRSRIENYLSKHGMTLMQFAQTEIGTSGHSVGDVAIDILAKADAYNLCGASVEGFIASLHNFTQADEAGVAGNWTENADADIGKAAPVRSPPVPESVAAIVPSWDSDKSCRALVENPGNIPRDAAQKLQLFEDCMSNEKTEKAYLWHDWNTFRINSRQDCIRFSLGDITTNNPSYVVLTTCLDAHNKRRSFVDAPD
jgi:hypothetical protein